MNCPYYSDTRNDCDLAPDQRATRPECATCEHQQTAKKTTAKTATKVAAQLEPITSGSCPNCARLQEIISKLEKRLERFKRFEAAQKGERQRSKRMKRLIANSELVFALHNAGASNRKQADLWNVSTASIARLLAGDLSNDNSGGN